MKDKLITRNYCLILAANFLLFFAFYLILPILPFFLKEEFQTGSGMIGVTLSCYTVAALCVRPFSGYLLDTFSRKPLYLMAYFIFACIFTGYMLASTLLLFVFMRMMHGVSFGTVTVAGNTIVIDITPSSRRGEALGYYGLTNNLAMSVGPMAGLFMHDYYSFTTIFCCSAVSAIIGFTVACMVKTPQKKAVQREPISLDRFILLKGLPAGLSLLLVSIPYGMTTSYVAMYAKQIGITSSAGLFFTLLALGMAVARIFSGKQADKGRIPQLIFGGLCLVAFSYLALSACAVLIQSVPQLTGVLFYLVAFGTGLGFGIMFPAFNTLFINLAPHNMRGTATSTYLISWDMGIGGGLIIGGIIAQHFSFSISYLVGACLTVVSAIYFKWKVAGHYNQNMQAL